MGKLAPKIKEHSEKSLTAFENINEIYRQSSHLNPKASPRRTKKIKRILLS